MLVLGSDDGVYCLSEPDATTAPAAERRLEAGRVRRVDQFDGQPGVFAATQTGLYHSHDAESWTDLSVPQEQVYTVGARDNRLYAGTKPAHVYTCPSLEAARTDGADAWEELDGFQDLPSREEWRLPRHENLAQVRDVHAVDDAVFAGTHRGSVLARDPEGTVLDESTDDWTVAGSVPIPGGTYGSVHAADVGR